MVNGFEDHTKELTKQDLEIANKMIPFLKAKTKDNRVYSSEIVNGLNKIWKLNPEMTDERLRRIINYYRTNAILPVISSSKGYYVSYDPQDIKRMIQSQKQRANSLLRTCSGLEKFLK